MTVVIGVFLVENLLIRQSKNKKINIIMKSLTFSLRSESKIEVIISFSKTGFKPYNNYR